MADVSIRRDVAVAVTTVQPREDGRDWTAAAVLFSILFVAVLNTVPIASNDLWLQLKIGQLTVDDRAIPRTVLFPFTPVRDAPFHAHEWLPSVVLHELARLLGTGGLMFVQGALGLAQFALSYLLARRLCGSTAIALALGGVAMLTVNYRYVLRPELFALLLFVALLLVLDRARDRHRRGVLLWTIPLAIVWANCHGSFLLGPVVAAIHALGEGLQSVRQASTASWPARLRTGVITGLPYAAAALAMLAASTINPIGGSLLTFAVELQSSDAVHTMIKEWLPTFHPLFMAEPAFWIFLLVCLGTITLVAASRRCLSATDALLLLVFGALALSRNRHIVWFAFVDLGVCARLLGGWKPRWQAREPHLRRAVAGLALTGLVACLALGNTRHAFFYDAPSNNFTGPMIEQLADPTLAGNVYNSYELGGELIYRAWPRLKPSIDSRFDSYGEAYFLGHQHLLEDEHALQSFLSAENVDHMLLLQRDFTNRVRDMRSLAATWHVRFADEKMLLLERNEAPPAPGTDSTSRTQERGDLPK